MARTKTVTVMVATALLLAGCTSGAASKSAVTPLAPASLNVSTGGATAPRGGTRPAPPPPAPDRATHAPTGTPSEPTSTGQGTHVGTTPAGASSSDSPNQGPAKSPAQAAKWYVKDIGYPMVTDDPAAKGAKVVMLTFDDGPTKEVTPIILDILKQNNVPAMFFVTGYGAKNEDTVKRELAEGHVVGTHTINHENLTQMSYEQAKKEINTVNDLVEKFAGQKPKFFRPPFGSYNANVLKIVREEDHMEVLNWTDGSLDWSEVNSKGWKDPQQIVADTMRQLHPGAIVLMHDTHMHTAAALPEIIKQMKEKGYEFIVMR